MEQCSPFGWIYFNEDEGMSDMRQLILQARMEMEATLLSAQEEILHLKDLLLMTIKERDEAQSKCQNLIMEKLLLHHQLKSSPFSNTTPKNDENYKPTTTTTTTTTTHSSSDSEESIISSSPAHAPPPQLPPQLTVKRQLPEKGRLLQAVVAAGPLLQTLMLAGPLPQWQQPPPQLDSIEIPPITPRLLLQDSNKKRTFESFAEGPLFPSPSPSPSKYQRIV